MTFLTRQRHLVERAGAVTGGALIGRLVTRRSRDQEQRDPSNTGITSPTWRGRPVQPIQRRKPPHGPSNLFQRPAGQQLA